MSTYEKMDLTALKGLLASGRYANATAARRGIARSSLSAKDRGAAQGLINAHFGEGATPVAGKKKVAKSAAPKKAAKKVQKKAQPKAAPKVEKTVTAPAEGADKRKKKTSVSGKKGAGRATAKAAEAATEAPAAPVKAPSAPKAPRARAARPEVASEAPQTLEGLNPLARINLLTELVGTSAEAIKALDLGRQLSPGLNTHGAEDAAAVINRSMGELRTISEGLVAAPAAPPPPPPPAYAPPPVPPIQQTAPVPFEQLSPEQQEEVRKMHAIGVPPVYGAAPQQG